MLERHQLRRGGTWSVFKLQIPSSLIVSDSDYCATFYPLLFLLFVFYILITPPLLLILLSISVRFLSLPRRVGSSVCLSRVFFRFTCTSVFAVRWHTQESPKHQTYFQLNPEKSFFKTGYFSHCGKITGKIWFGSFNEKWCPTFPPVKSSNQPT